MKLIVIVLCLLSERYLVHAISFTRFDWFGRYVEWLLAQYYNIRRHDKGNNSCCLNQIRSNI